MHSFYFSLRTWSNSLEELHLGSPESCSIGFAVCTSVFFVASTLEGRSPSATRPRKTAMALNSRLYLVCGGRSVLPRSPGPSICVQPSTRSASLRSQLSRPLRFIARPPSVPASYAPTSCSAGPSSQSVLIHHSAPVASIHCPFNFHQPFSKRIAPVPSFAFAMHVISSLNAGSFAFFVEPAS
jgi:hypothetical protein